MTSDPTLDHPLREDAHPKVREALPDFFWDASDPSSPFASETGLEVLEELRAARVENPRGDIMSLLGELLERWEVADEHWDTVDAGEVQSIGEEDEYSLLARDEILLALAFGQLVVEGRLDGEVRRRAVLALVRQALPALMYGRGEPSRTRAPRIERMREILSRRWD